MTNTTPLTKEELQAMLDGWIVCDEPAPVDDAPATLCDEARRVIYGDREETYGHPSANLDRIAKIWSVIFGVDVTPEQVCWAMVGMKMAREVNAKKDDNIVDSFGYLMLIERVREVM
jgi:hypothetical protein